MSEPSDYKIHSYAIPRSIIDVILKTVVPTIAKEILICEKQSLAVSVYPLRYGITLTT